MNTEAASTVSLSPLSRWQGFERDRPLIASILRISAVTFQFGLLILAIDRYQLVGRSFLHLCILSLAGFVVHSVLPVRYRLMFFLGLSLAGIVLVLGWHDATWLISIGFLLIGLCHIPIPFKARIALIVATGLALGHLRMQGPEGPVSAVVLALLGSMFMFRLIIYLHDLPAEKPGVSRIWSMTYFFLLPNVCFPLFPVIDYKQFRSTYYNQSGFLIYQRGINWIFRGIYHLLIYRVVYLHFTIDPAQVSGAEQLLQYSISSFLLYLRVSGTFHLIVGMLLLFGFNLPETHHHYYLASSFTDFWRRINIYWKEFMRRIFFFPSNFRLRGLGQLPALMLSTMVVFLGTWVLHSYQWFWLTGTVLFESHDSLFWATLGVLVALNMLYENKNGAEPTWGRGNWNLCSGTALVCRTAATFITICTLWGMWTADSLGQWLEMWAGTGHLSLALAIGVIGLYAISFTLQRLERTRSVPKARIRTPPAVEPFWPSVLRTGVGSLLVIAFAHPAVYEHFGREGASLIESIQADRLNARDQKAVERGYYEKLLSNDLTSGLLQHYVQEARVTLKDSNAWRERQDLLLGELVPNAQVTLHTGELRDLNSWTVTVNSLGLRDREYSQSKPPDTQRIAFLGSSHLMGHGIENEEMFEALLEDRVAAERRERSNASKFESLNFGVNGQSMLQSLYTLQTKTLSFEPDAAVLITHANEREFVVRTIVRMMIRHGQPIPYASVQNLLDQQGITPSMDGGAIELRLNAIRDELIAVILREFADICRRNGIRPVLAYIPLTDEGTMPTEATLRLEAAQEAGFDILSLEGIYESHRRSEVWLSHVDRHPNAFGHRLIADRLYELMREAQLL